MEKQAISERKILPVLASVLIIVVLMGLAFLPAVRHADKNAAAVSRDINNEALDALYNCIDHAETHGFTAKLSGTIKAHVVGVPYTVNVRGDRKANGKEFTSVKESVSAIVKLGLKAENIGGEYRVSRGEYDKATGEFVYTEPEKWDKARFDEAFGRSATLLRYDIDGNIISAERIDENMYKYQLDVSAAERCKAEVSSFINCKTPPEYKSIELTLVTDGDRAVKVSAVEKFRVAKFGGVTCVAEYGEEIK